MKRFFLSGICAGFLLVLPINMQPVFAGRVTLVEYNQLQIGMEYREVKKIMGREGELYPEAIATNPDDLKTAYRWRNDDGSAIVVIFDFSDRLVSIRSYNLNVTDFGELSGKQPNNSITKQLYDRLKLGMTYQEISNLMGREGDIDSSFNLDALQDSIATDDIAVNSTLFELGLRSREEVERDNQKAIETLKAAYKWINPDGTGVMVVFNTEDRAVAIYSYGLGVGLP